MSNSPYDVIVVGAGNAALCAAIAARETGARVLALEKAAEAEKGGNSYFTAGGFRFVHSGLDDVRKDVLVDMADAEAGKIVFPGHDRQLPGFPFPRDKILCDAKKFVEPCCRNAERGGYATL